MSKIIALDGDGVLLDFHAAYRQAWARAFGTIPNIRDPQAYWPMDRWEVARLEGAELTKFREHFDHPFWTTVPPLPGAIDAYTQLVSAGFELVCVTAIAEQYQPARLQNLRNGGFPIEQVVATSYSAGDVSPKADALRALRPVAFVDDYLPFMKGIPADVHAALITRELNGSPNTGPDLDLVHSTHDDLSSFAVWWLERDGR
jgi:phosphoglycolate phosphatase-like HAD superfamily hydrolase